MPPRTDCRIVYCDILEQWSKLMIKAEQNPQHYGNNPMLSFEKAWANVHLAIKKSCLLDRMMYRDENPSQTPCPVHKGIWSGCQLRGSRLMPDGLWHMVWVNWDGKGESVGEAEGAQYAAERAAGCRCFMHTCGCTTGWNVDEHCGCLPLLKEKGIIINE